MGDVALNSELQNPTAFMVDGPIAHTRASDTARQFILSRIFTGELGPGDRLPNERELSAQLGISRLTLREALKSLETAGYLVTKVGAQGGTRVSDAQALTRCFDEWLRAQGERLKDLLETHGIIEVAIASLAAERRTETDLRAMEAAQVPPMPPDDLCKNVTGHSTMRWRKPLTTNCSGPSKWESEMRFSSPSTICCLMSYPTASAARCTTIMPGSLMQCAIGIRPGQQPKCDVTWSIRTIGASRWRKTSGVLTH